MPELYYLAVASVTLGGNMSKEPLKLQDLIRVSEESDSPDDVLYRFVSAYREGYEIEGCEEEAICLLVNFSVRRDQVEDPLNREEAIKHLQEKDFQLIRRYKDSLRGYHTHNTKFPLSFLRSNVFCDLPYDETDPYVHSGSVKLNKRYGYAQNAKYIKAAKAILAEFYYQGVRTSMIEEFQRDSILSHLFLGLLEESAERNCKSSDQYD